MGSQWNHLIADKTWFTEEENKVNITGIRLQSLEAIWHVWNYFSFKIIIFLIYLIDLSVEMRFDYSTHSTDNDSNLRISNVWIRCRYSHIHRKKSGKLNSSQSLCAHTFLFSLSLPTLLWSWNIFTLVNQHLSREQSSSSPEFHRKIFYSSEIIKMNRRDEWAEKRSINQMKISDYHIVSVWNLWNCVIQLHKKVEQLLFSV